MSAFSPQEPEVPDWLPTESLAADLSELCPDSLIQRLTDQAAEVDSEGAWPKASLSDVATAGILAANLPREFGGTASGTPVVTGLYVGLGSGCLSTAFVLTQRNGACERIVQSQNLELKAEVLPKLATGEQFVTLGISHLTTSRQHLRQPAVRATAVPGGYRLCGEMPWVTGAIAADELLCGATLEDGRQLLGLVPRKSDGVQTGQPPRLLALNATQTGPVVLHDVFLAEHRIVAGPIREVMKAGSGGGTGSLNTSALALGHATGILRHFASEARERQDLWESYRQLQHESAHLARAFWMTLTAGTAADSAMDQTLSSPQEIRQRANSLCLRASQAYLTAAKGAGFLASHPAARLVRESMFFLVWSCPQPVMAAQIEELACAGDRWFDS